MMLSTLHLYLIQPDRNCYRYDELSVQPGLFQEWSLRRSWGRMGTKGRDKTVWFSSREEAEQFFERKRKEKLRRGYLPALFPMAPYHHMQVQGRPKSEGVVQSSSQSATPTYRVSENQQKLFS